MNTSNPLLEIIGNERRFLPCAVYRKEPDDKKLTKIPQWFDGTTLTATNWQNPDHWLTAREAITLAYNSNRGIDTLSVQLSGPDHDITGIDLDECVTDGRIVSERAVQIVQDMDSYTTHSVSGSGLHIWVVDRTHLIPEKYAETNKVGIFRHSKNLAEKFESFGPEKPVRVITDPAEAREICRVLGVKPIDEVAVAPPVKPFANTNGVTQPTTLGDKAYWAAGLLKRLSPTRCDDYSEWIYVGMCLSELGDTGLKMWDDWSKASSKYEPGACEKKWATFKAGQGLTLGSLYKAANDDDPGGTATRTYSTGAKVDLNCAPDDSDTTTGQPLDGTMDAMPEDTLAELPALPEIRTNGRGLTEVTADAMLALIEANNPPELFVRSGELVRIVMDEKGRPNAQSVTEDILCRRMAETANYVTVRMISDGELITPRNPPSPVVRNILAAGHWNLPALTGIIESPTLRPDGTVLMASGYDTATKLFHAPTPGLTLETIPERPSPDDVSVARKTLEDVFSEFQFSGTADLANALGLLLTCVIRPAIPGLIPMALLDANQPGSGKTMIAVIVMHTATGHAIMECAPQNPDEWPKVLTTSLKAGRTIICYDNVDHILNSGALANVLSSEEHAGRLLGTNEEGRYAQRSVWIATGNNINVGGDLPRRCYSISLVSDTARPEEREFVNHPDLLSYVKLHRANLLRATLILARNWFADGQPIPKGMPQKRGYDGWVRTIYGILSNAGITGFLGNLETLYQESDVEGQQWGAFLYALSGDIGSKQFLVSQVFEKIGANSDLAGLALQAVRGMTTDKEGKFTLGAKQAMARVFRTKNKRRVAYMTDRGRIDICIERTGKDGKTEGILYTITAGLAGLAGLNPVQSQNNTRKQEDGIEDTIRPLTENNPANPVNPALDLWDGEL